ncbi:NAD(P)/FAD-dependent oxidoreductase [Chelativorans sp. AA-79]|uniref:FAD/NAD(P)-dependent oxidoreductase n=1 Tax=Chelativorans sp. AA-79 TaxID=3028735 RepID=UPI0023F8B3BB|nr:NAD(P)/FAD-dependent oxidoreductase [Chelativorans sp. AA-79]WEX08271.1 NAD(P)/FAD-dependent oxidoreductase [Chelativorans sp. AA-79]
MKRHDVAIIGAGPAGMAAAVEACAQDLSVVVLDEQPAPGGQIYRAIETASTARRAMLGADYDAGAALAAAFRASGADYRPGAMVWNIEPGFRLDVSIAGGSLLLHADAVIVATGAIERPVPLPGWTLPGVMTAGALQILLKSHGGVADDVVLVGAGPLLYLLASQMLAAGAPPRAIVETVPRARHLLALRHLPQALRGWPYLRKGLAMMHALRKARVPIHRNARNIRIEGSEAAEAVSFSSGRQTRRIPAGMVALHQGVVPNQQVTRMLRCAHRWHDTQHCFVPVVDTCFETTEPGIFAAGDGAGIGGAVSAALRGRLAALRVAEKAGRTVPTGAVGALRRTLARDAATRPFLETLYAPAEEILAPSDETLVCRCEEVTAGQIRTAVADGAPGPNQVKSFLRCGMGPCQGRVCGLAVTELVAAGRGMSPADAGYFRIRPPLKPLSLAELAAIETE